jgi:hypothetical protein
MKKQARSSKTVWVLVDVEAAEHYVDPGMRYVRYCGDEDFAMFSHTVTDEVLEALQFNSCREAFNYLNRNACSLFHSKTTFPREATIRTIVKL